MSWCSRHQFSAVCSASLARDWPSSPAPLASQCLNFEDSEHGWCKGWHLRNSFCLLTHRFCSLLWIVVSSILRYWQNMLEDIQIYTANATKIDAKTVEVRLLGSQSTSLSLNIWRLQWPRMTNTFKFLVSNGLRKVHLMDVVLVDNCHCPGANMHQHLEPLSVSSFLGFSDV